MSERIHLRYDPPTGNEVFHWPEFIALAERLGIDLLQPIRDICIFLPLDGCAIITEQNYGNCLESARVVAKRLQLQAEQDQAKAAETTTIHNEQFKTFKPLSELPNEPNQVDIEMVQRSEGLGDE